MRNRKLRLSIAYASTGLTDMGGIVGFAPPPHPAGRATSPQGVLNGPPRRPTVTYCTFRRHSRTESRASVPARARQPQDFVRPVCRVMKNRLCDGRVSRRTSARRMGCPYPGVWAAGGNYVRTRRSAVSRGVSIAKVGTEIGNPSPYVRTWAGWASRAPAGAPQGRPVDLISIIFATSCGNEFRDHQPPRTRNPRCGLPSPTFRSGRWTAGGPLSGAGLQGEDPVGETPSARPRRRRHRRRGPRRRGTARHPRRGARAWAGALPPASPPALT